jgi:hypothetical protein
MKQFGRADLENRVCLTGCGSETLHIVKADGTILCYICETMRVRLLLNSS